MILSSIFFIPSFFVSSSFVVYPLIIIFNLIFLTSSFYIFKIRDLNFHNLRILFFIFIIFLFFFFQNSFVFYFEKISLIQLIRCVFSFVFIIYLLFFLKPEKKLKYLNFISIVVLMFIGVLFFSLYAIDIDHPYMANSLNYGVVVMPIIGLINGAEIPIDIQSQYGLYPYFFNLLFMVAPFNFYNLNFVFAALFLFSIFSLYFVMYKISRNIIISLFSILSSLSLLTVFGNAWPGELYFQFTPIRIFLPSFALLIFYFYLKESISFNILILLICMGFFWNFDTFVPIVASLIIYFQLCENRLFSKKIFLISLIPIFCFCIFQVYIKFKTDYFFDIFELFAPQLSFKNNSYFNSDNLSLLFIAMTNFIFLYYFFFKSKQNILVYKFGLFVSILSILLLPYGFKHPAPLALASFLIPLSYTIFMSSRIKSEDSSFYKSVLLLPLFFLSFIFIDNLKFDRIKNYINLPFVDDNYIYPYPTDDLLSTRYISKSELKDRQLYPIWLNKINTINMLINTNSIKSFDNIFVASERDHLHYYYLNSYNPLGLVNWHHVANYNHWSKIFDSLDNAKFDYVITDSSYLYENADSSGRHNFKTFENKLKKNYSKVLEIDDGYEWYHPGFKKSFTSLYIKK